MRNNLSCIRHETSRHFKNKKREYQKGKINELATNSKNKNSDLFADSHNTLNRWKNCLSRLLNVHNVRNIKHTDILIAEPLVPDPSPFDVGIATAKLKKV
jgi:hypothetical protein